jgi:uncharacterized membrane protein SirB2
VPAGDFEVLTQIGEALQNNSVIVMLNSTGWMAAGLEIIHYFSMFVLVGSIAIVDLRVMGLAGNQQSATKLAQRLFPWMWTALALNFLSGFVMFAGIAASYIPDSTFHLKMWVILAAVVFGIIVQWRVPVWDKLPSMPVAARLLAAVSLLLWVGAILAGNELPALSGLG